MFMFMFMFMYAVVTRLRGRVLEQLLTHSLGLRKLEHSLRCMGLQPLRHAWGCNL